MRVAITEVNLTSTSTRYKYLLVVICSKQSFIVHPDVSLNQQVPISNLGNIEASSQGSVNIDNDAAAVLREVDDTADHHP